MAGRRVPAFFNGMATGADWMSAASFIGMAGTLYLTGFDGLAFVMGWTGGYVLVALLLAPYLRKFGQFTIPDFLGARYGGNIARTHRRLRRDPVLVHLRGGADLRRRPDHQPLHRPASSSVGVFVGLAGILVCSFLGGMRAVTWTQVAQYIILIIAYMIPVVWLSVKHTGIPIPQIVYGKVLREGDRAREGADQRSEGAARCATSSRRAPTTASAKLKGLPALRTTRARPKLAAELEKLKADERARRSGRRGARRRSTHFPKDAAAAKAQWTKDAGLAARAGPPLRARRGVSRARTKPRATSRAATSWRWCSA